MASGAMLEQLGLTEAAGRLVRTYSGGMRRKLDLGASLVGAPRLLLLDEPTIGLDPRSRLELWHAIRDLVGRGTDVLLTTQYLEEADHLASHIVIEVHVRDRQDLSKVAAWPAWTTARPRSRSPRGG